MDRHTTFDDLFSILSSGIGQRALYFSAHPKVTGASRDFVSSLDSLLVENELNALFLGLADGQLVHEGRFLLGPTILGKRLVNTIASLQSGGLLFRRGLAEDELRRFLDLAIELSDGANDLEHARGFLLSRGIEHIELSPPYESPDWFGQFLFSGCDEFGGMAAGEESAEELVPVFQGLFDTVDSAHARARDGHEVDVDGTRSISETLISNASGGFGDVMRLVRYPDYDTFTVGHSVRVALLSVMVGHRLGLQRHELVELGTAGLLHDVGKSRIPDQILFKPGRLDDEERRIISSHPELGAGILLESGQCSALAIGAAWGHHLRHDGHGYPKLADWSYVGRMTQVIQVCDVFEALTAVRPYKKAMTPRRALEIMLKDRRAYEPGALRAFVDAVGIYPPGHRVVLSNGARAMVTEPGAHLALPRVRVTHDEMGTPIARADQRLVDLATSGLAVRRLLDEDLETAAESTARIEAEGLPTLCFDSPPGATPHAH